VLDVLNRLFPVWILLAGVIGLVHPPAFTWFSGPLIVWGLAVIMLGMGITLTFDDFRQVLAAPRPVLLGFVGQFTIMPLLAWAVATTLELDTPFAVGLILTGACPGGTASNVVTYLARANVPLSVLMTTCSTMGAIVLTPLLTAWLAGTLVPVDAWGLFLSTVQVVLLPVVLGLTLNQLSPRLVRVVQPVAPLVAILAIALIVGSIVGQSAAAIRGSAGVLTLAVVLLHSGGFALGHLLGRVFGYEEAIQRTVSIEVGMQNSGLSVVLARQHFADPLTAVPGAMSSVAHTVIGSLLAAAWRRRGVTPAAGSGSAGA